MEFSGVTILGATIAPPAAGSGNQAIYGSGPTAITNLVSNLGVVATDTTGVGTARYGLAAAAYG